MSVSKGYREDLSADELDGRKISKIGFTKNRDSIPNFRNYRRVPGTMYADLENGIYVLVINER